MRAVTLVAILSLLGGCFPHDAHKRTIAQLVEGGTLVAGVGMGYFANSQADCDQEKQMRMPPSKCGGFAQTMDSISVAFILAGLVGFIATITTAEDASAHPDSDRGTYPHP